MTRLRAAAVRLLDRLIQRARPRPVPPVGQPLRPYRCDGCGGRVRLYAMPTRLARAGCTDVCARCWARLTAAVVPDAPAPLPLTRRADRGEGAA